MPNSTVRADRVYTVEAGHQIVLEAADSIVIKVAGHEGRFEIDTDGQLAFTAINPKADQE